MDPGRLPQRTAPAFNQLDPSHASLVVPCAAPECFTAVLAAATTRATSAAWVRLVTPISSDVEVCEDFLAFQLFSGLPAGRTLWNNFISGLFGLIIGHLGRETRGKDIKAGGLFQTFDDVG